MNKVQPKILPGFMELLPLDQILFNEMYDTIRSIYERYGFLPLDTPTIELSEVLLAKAGGETEQQIYRFNKGDNDLSLRFDLTVPLARYVAMNYNDLVFPFKRYQMSKVFRGERNQRGRFREFYQCDIDVIGNESLDTIYDAEMPAIIYEIFSKLDIGNFTIRISNRKILKGLINSLGLNNPADILRIIDKILKIGEASVKEELLKLGLTKNDIDAIMNLVLITGNPESVIKQLTALNIDNDLYKEGLNELIVVVDGLNSFGIKDRYKIDMTLVRGLDYYTGTVYETILDDYPELGSICGGGRYEDLATYYTDQKLPGIGISIGLTRLFFQLKDANIIKSDCNSAIKVLVIPFDKNSVSYSLNISSQLRNANINTDMYYIDNGIKQKLKYANRLNIPYVIIIGDEELKEKKVTLKDMISGEQEKLTIDEAINKLTT